MTLGEKSLYLFIVCLFFKANCSGWLTKPVQSMCSPNASSASRYKGKFCLSANPYVLVLSPAVASGMQFQDFWYAIIIQIFLYPIGKKTLNSTHYKSL